MNKKLVQEYIDYAKKVQKEEAPTNATGAAVVGTGDNPVHWKDRKKKKPTVLRRFRQFF